MRRLLCPLLLCAAALLSACDTERATRLEEGVSTEADVRRQFGEPVQLTERADGSKLLAYPRQPEGWTNYEAEIGADGKLTALRQLLTEANFAKVQPGMAQAAVAKLLGRHARELRHHLLQLAHVHALRLQLGEHCLEVRGAAAHHVARGLGAARAADDERVGRDRGLDCAWWGVWRGRGV